MIELILAGLVFVAAHVLPATTGFRAWAMERLGRPVYLAGYSMLSIALLAWVVRAALNAPHIGLWPPSAHGSLAAIVLMAPACWLAVGGLRRPNPVSISLLSGETPLSDPGPQALTRHPVLWSFGLWALGHVAANGDVAAALLFGLCALFALVGARVLDRRARRNGTVQLALTGGIGRRLALAFSGTGWLDLAIAAGVYAALIFLHPVIIGVSPLALVE